MFPNYQYQSIGGPYTTAENSSALSPPPPPPPPAPVADFTGTPTSGSSPLEVVFTDESSGSPTSWLWEKNDSGGWVEFDGTPTEQNPTETFSDGTWSVRLTATNTGGSDTKTRTDYITVSSSPPPPPPPPPPAPVADFYGSPTSGDAPLNVAFYDTSTETPSTWVWEKNNNNTGWFQFSVSQNPSESLDEGVWSIRLTATNSYGSDTKTRTDYITVTAPPPPPPPSLTVQYATYYTDYQVVAIGFNDIAVGYEGFTMTVNGNNNNLIFYGGESTMELLFQVADPILPGDSVLLSYAPGNVVGLDAFSGYTVTIM